MRNTLKSHLLPAVGGGTGITYEAVKEATTATIPIIQHPRELLHYFLAGLLGALGGLVLKILWHQVKRKFPKLKDSDK